MHRLPEPPAPLHDERPARRARPLRPQDGDAAHAGHFVAGAAPLRRGGEVGRPSTLAQGSPPRVVELALRGDKGAADDAARGLVALRRPELEVEAPSLPVARRPSPLVGAARSHLERVADGARVAAKHRLEVLLIDLFVSNGEDQPLEDAELVMQALREGVEVPVAVPLGEGVDVAQRRQPRPVQHHEIHQVTTDTLHHRACRTSHVA